MDCPPQAEEALLEYAIDFRQLAKTEDEVFLDTIGMYLGKN